MLTVPAFAWARPATVAEVIAELGDAARGEVLLIAGGTDAVPNLKHRLHEPRRIVHLAGVRELHFVREDADGLHLGALVRLSELGLHPRVREAWPAVAEAAGRVASPQIRNMGTLGGNLCLDTRCTYYNQTFFWREALGFCLKKDGTRCHVVPQGKRCVAAHSSDVAPVLIALGAEVEVASAAGRRWLAVEDFFVGDGVHNTVLQPGELVTQVRLPAASAGHPMAYQKLRPRGAIDFPMLSVAAAGRLEGGTIAALRVVVSALGAKPRTLGQTDGLALGHAPGEAVWEAVAQAAHRQCRPLTNIPYDADWRHAMVPVFVRRVLRDAFAARAA
jgi:4-hydroxybenzoyl-CoA reductase subunit beta